MESLDFSKHPEHMNIAMAQSSLSAKTLRFCMANLTLGGKQDTRVCLSILPGLCEDLLLGLNFQKKHWSVIFHHGGLQSPLEVCGLSVLKVKPPDLFADLTSDSHPIPTKSWWYNHVDKEIIDTEVQHILKEGIIEPSNPPW